LFLNFCWCDSEKCWRPHLGEGENTTIFRKQSEVRRTIDTFVEITVNNLDVNANFRKRRKIESP